MSDAQTWLIEPRDPLIARDGRAFDAAPGARAVSLPFPFSSTLAGALRTRAGSFKDGREYFDGNDAALIEAVKRIQVLGPLLVEFDSDQRATPLAPAPADALFMKDTQDEQKVNCKRLVPMAREAGDWCDLDRGDEQAVLVGIQDPDKTAAKPYDRAPRFWQWNRFAEWLLDPPGHQAIEVEEWGHGGARPETRSHVAIDGETHANRDGALFQTRGLRFSHVDKKRGESARPRRLGLALHVSDLNGLELREGIAPLGGERRLVAWRRSEAEGDGPWPAIPAGVLDKIALQGACRLHLLTPAFFGKGWYPEYLLQEYEGVQPQIVTVALGRFQTVSGWDFQARNGKGAPKPSRRLAPAGAVYFLKLAGNSDGAARRAWAQRFWLQSVSDDAASRADGFGLAALGTWSGQLELRKEVS